ncbi:MAG: hypothetical protein Q9213_007439 [Squamulea squamosa]
MLIDINPPNLPVFTVDLNPQRPGSEPTVEIGRIDREKANGDLQHAPVNNTGGWWAVDDIVFEVEGKNVTKNHSMIFDTGGSSIISVRPEVADAYYSHLNGTDIGNNGTYWFECNTPLIDLTMHAGNGTAVWRASLLDGGKGVAGRKYPHFVVLVLNEGGELTKVVDVVCTAIIHASENGPWNVGEAFFKAHFAVFDYEEPAILYAPFN